MQPSGHFEAPVGCVLPGASSFTAIFYDYGTSQTEPGDGPESRTSARHRRDAQLTRSTPS